MCIGRFKENVAEDSGSKAIASVDLEGGLDGQVAAGYVDSESGHLLAYGGAGDFRRAGIPEYITAMVLGELKIRGRITLFHLCFAAT